jgi:hypothetical protein
MEYFVESIRLEPDVLEQSLVRESVPGRQDEAGGIYGAGGFSVKVGLARLLGVGY